eukprot:GFYU01025639.1.p1 GENE.GFYU01025639.1~~GFYU01025639.1.p1  ORF type:complete len:297 (+),score=30.31 GFYU01025639.1:32-892(+)
MTGGTGGGQRLPSMSGSRGSGSSLALGPSSVGRTSPIPGVHTTVQPLPPSPGRTTGLSMSHSPGINRASVASSGGVPSVPPNSLATAGSVPGLGITSSDTHMPHVHHQHHTAQPVDIAGETAAALDAQIAAKQHTHHRTQPQGSLSPAHTLANTSLTPVVVKRKSTVTRSSLHAFCTECDKNFALVHCQDCQTDQCFDCDDRIHAGGSRQRHQRVYMKCDECGGTTAEWLCQTCEQRMCPTCDTTIHNKGTRVNHNRDRIYEPEPAPVVKPPPAPEPQNCCKCAIM